MKAYLYFIRYRTHRNPVNETYLLIYANDVFDALKKIDEIYPNAICENKTIEES